jgi:hypothetical protein
MRYCGVDVDVLKDVAEISQGNGNWLRISADLPFFTPCGGKGRALFSSFARMENCTHFSFLEHVALVGQAAVQSAMAGEQASDFDYFLGQRRVPRMSVNFCDAPQIDIANTVDEGSISFGPLSRFGWKLVGK